jgi:hypothetical protein
METGDNQERLQYKKGDGKENPLSPFPFNAVMNRTTNVSETNMGINWEGKS